MIVRPGIGIEHFGFEVRLGDSRDSVNGRCKEVLDVKTSTLPPGSRKNTDQIAELGVYIYYDADNSVKEIEYDCSDNFTIEGFECTERTFSELADQIVLKDPSSASDENTIESKKLGLRLWINDIDDADDSPPDSILVFLP